MAYTDEMWAEVKKKYCYGQVLNGVHGFPSLSDLEKEYKVNKSNISRKAKRDNWDIQKTRFINKNLEKLEEKVARKYATKNTDCNETQNGTQSIAKINYELSQADIDAESDKLTDEIIQFDVTVNAITSDMVNLIKRNMDLIKIRIDGQEKEYRETNDPSAIKSVNPSELLMNVKALEKVQSVYKNTIGEMLPNGKGGDTNIAMYTQINRMHTEDIEKEIKRLELSVR